MPGEYLPPIVQVFKGDADDLLKTIGEVDAAYEGLGKRSKKTTDGIGKDEKDSEKAISDFDRLLRSKLKDDETALQGAQREFAAARARVQDLRSELQRSTGPNSLGLYQDLKHAEAEAKKVEGILGDIRPKARQLGESAGDEFIRGVPFAGPAAMALGKGFVKLLASAAPSIFAEAEQLGAKAAKALGDGVASAGDAVAQDVPALFTPEGAAGAAVIAAIVLTLAPAIATALGGAITAGVGLGTIGLGGFLLKDEPGIKNAASRLKNDVLGVFKAGAGVLTEPFEQAMGKLDGFFTSGASHIHDLFAAVAPAIGPVEQMVESLVSAIGPALVDDARMFTAIFSDPQFQSDVKGLGQNIAAFFETIAHHKDEVELFFRVLMGLASEVLGVFNALMNVAGFLAGPLKWLDSHLGPGNQVTAKWHDATDSVSGFAAAVEKAVPDVSVLTKKLNEQVQTTDTLAGAMSDKLFSSIMANQKATLAYWEASTALDEAIKQNGRTVDITRANGQRNIEAILSAVQANIDLYDEQIRLGMSAKDAATAYDANTRALEAHLRKLHLTKDQIDAVVGAYRKVPDKVDSTIAIQGLTDAINNLDNLLRTLNGLPPLTTVTVHEKFVADKMPDFTHRGKFIPYGDGGVVRAADGLVSGILPPSDPGTLMVLAGEQRTRGEIFMPLAGISSSRAAGLAQVAGDAYGFDVVPKVSRSFAYAGSGGVQSVTIPVYVGGRYITTVYADLMQHSQRVKARTGSTGLA